MAKKGSTTKTPKPKTLSESVKSLTLSFELAELPSSQHRAGLAGLVMMIEWIKRLPAERRQGKLDVARFDESGLTVEIDRQGLRDLLDETYAASTEEYWRKDPLKTKNKDVIDPIRTEVVKVEDKKGNVKQETHYFYETTVPRGAFLADPSFDKSSDGKNGVWVKQWRDLVWSVFRSVPATRTPYENRASGRKCKDVDEVWKQLSKPVNASVELPSTYFIGAQAFNAENVSFSDRARDQFLLHFWQFVIQVYRPAVYDSEGKRELEGYAIAIPDIGMLKTFCDAFKEMMASRGIETLGISPRESIVDVAIESGLDFMRRLNDRLTVREGGSQIQPWVIGVDVFHLEREGNNVRLRSTSRIDPDLPMIDNYSVIRKSYWDFRFRIQQLKNLVASRSWFEGYHRIAATVPFKATIQSKLFQHDAREAFKTYLPISITAEQELSMNETQSKPKYYKEPSSLEEAIYSMIGQYLSKKLKSKYDLEWKPAWKDADSNAEQDDYKKKREKIATETFLQIRSRTNSQDFTSFFSSTICSVSQILPEGAYKIVADSLLHRPEDVRNLTLLALSARS
jgi:CRISPR-associated protein Cmx8